MASIGERLRQERLRRGFDLQQIAERTKINANLLELIEADDLESLPGIFFTRSFVRQYAKALELDEAEFESELDRLAGCERVPMIEPKPVTPAEMQLPPVGAANGRARPQRPLGSLITLVLIVAACSAIYVLYQRAHEFKPPAAAASAQEPAKPTPESTKPPETAPPLTSAPDSTASGPSGASGPSAEKPSTTADPAKPPATPEPAAATPAVAGPPGPVHVEIHATDAVWVRLAADGKYLFSGVIQANQTRIVDGQQLVQLKAGNAAGLQVSLNGRPVGALGPSGQVRNVEFTPAGFKILAPSAPQPEQSDDEP